MISRRAGESVLIGEDIEIRVLETGSRRIKLGIQAPEDFDRASEAATRFSADALLANQGPGLRRHQ